MKKIDLLKTILMRKWKWMNLSFSQEGEDIILSYFLETDKPFYVDVGAYHPYCFSNTMRYYLQGGHGINIDATPGSMKLFNKWRKRDVNVEAGISKESGEKLEYYVYQEGALNTFGKERKEYLHRFGYEPIDTYAINTYSIMDIMDKYVPQGQKIDFLDVDVEGLDEMVIETFDFKKYKPSIILAETFSSESSAGKKLESEGYTIVAFTGRTAIYMVR